jgi:hypothetical protein
MSRGRLFWGGVLVGVGLLLLLDNLGYLGGIDVWSLIFALFLIALGIWILWGRFFRGTPETEHISIPIENVQQSSIRFQHGAGRLFVSSGAAPGVLLEGDFGGGLEMRKNMSSGKLDIRLNTPTQIFPFFWSPGFSLDWNVVLSQELPLTLNLETGASDTRLDLRELKVAKLTLKTGASSTKLTLPANAGFTSVTIESGAASVDVQLPEGVAARVRSRSGLSSLVLDRQRFIKSGDTFQSSDYESALNKVDLDIQMGVGSVSIR